MYLMTILIIAFNEISTPQNPALTASKISAWDIREQRLKLSRIPLAPA